MKDELKKLIEPNRFLILSKLLLFNKIYAEYLLNFEKYKNRINYSENHLFWSNKNELLESKHVGIYGFNKKESWDSILEDNQLNPLLISYISIKSIMQNDKKIFDKWQLSFDNLAEELNNSINNVEDMPEDILTKFKNLISDIKENR
ncbi:MAG: hypothetical protein P8Z35_09865 [Ignavibacteriaceae bacterium]